MPLIADDHASVLHGAQAIFGNVPDPVSGWERGWEQLSAGASMTS
jgi:hypothetical protein